MTRTADIFEKQAPVIKKTNVTVYYGKPIYLKEQDPEVKKHAGAYTRDVIIEMLKEIQ